MSNKSTIVARRRRPVCSHIPIRHGGMVASRASTWPRDHFCRSTIALCRSRPTTWRNSCQYRRLMTDGRVVVSIGQFGSHQQAL